MYHVRRRWCLAHLAGMLCGLAAFGSSEQDRALRQIVTTTACQNIRPADDYPARIDMIYVYFLDYYVTGDNDDNNDDITSLDMTGLERAIATSVASTLNRCDDQRYPVYAVELSEASAHEVIATGT